MNLKKVLALVLVLVFTVSTAMAIEGGNSRKGKALFKKDCKSCHDAGGEGGELTPMAKTMKQWDRYFEKNSADHPADVFKTVSEKDLKDIQQFLYDHAKDSPAPATCG